MGRCWFDSTLEIIFGSFFALLLLAYLIGNFFTLLLIAYLIFGWSYNLCEYNSSLTGSFIYGFEMKFLLLSLPSVVPYS